ncbi:MAG: 4Fe-4S dicluster domain-containing protein [Ruminococcaceae bacterium]|nr:4Fe-4S dicluster domain-containing protein [Oscillospiraceae bacterium]
MNNKGTYYHSVRLDRERCKGCINCIKGCPTEAIRVRDGKAKIIKERCIDCGECIRVCPYHAKSAVTERLDDIFRFKYKIALPAPTLYGQFNNLKDINLILTGLKYLGFDDIYEVAKAAETITEYTKQLLAEGKLKRPVINSACPTVVRLISVRFPNLISHVLPLISPMEAAAKAARQEAVEKTGLKPKEIGVFFISPCAAKATSVRNPLGSSKPLIDGVLSIKEIYLKLLPILRKIEHVDELSTCAFSGVRWASSGGEASALDTEKYVAVDGINHVVRLLEEIEDDEKLDIDFVEALACAGGCVGGPLNVENTYVAKTKIKKLADSLRKQGQKAGPIPVKQDDLQWDSPVSYRNVLNLDDDIAIAMQKMERMESIYNDLPKLDCGSCGAPSCKSLAEDIVRGFATETDCIYKLREKVRDLARQMVALEEEMPGSFKTDDRDYYGG